MNRHLLVLLLVSNILAACNSASTVTHFDSSGPDTKTILCEALGKDPDTEPLCKYTRDSELQRLLLSVFPLGVATRSDVYARLGVYLLSTDSTSSKTRIYEHYAIEQTLFADAPVKAIFSFDKEGILRHVEIVDIL